MNENSLPLDVGAETALHTHTHKHFSIVGTNIYRIVINIIILSCTHDCTISDTPDRGVSFVPNSISLGRHTTTSLSLRATN